MNDAGAEHTSGERGEGGRRQSKAMGQRRRKQPAERMIQGCVCVFGREDASTKYTYSSGKRLTEPLEARAQDSAPHLRHLFEPLFRPWREMCWMHVRALKIADTSSGIGKAKRGWGRQMGGQSGLQAKVICKIVFFLSLFLQQR